MRRWPWIVLGLAAAFAGVLAYAAANLNRYLAENRDALAERASAALGRKVTFDQVAVSFAHGLGVAVDGLSVADDPRFASGSFLDAKRAVVRVRVLPALFGRYEIASVLLDAPKLAVVRTQDGLNVESLGSKPEAAKSGDATSSSAGAVAVALVDVEDGKLVFTDKTVKPTREITVDALDLSASDWSAGESLRFELAAAILGASSPNIKASGAVGPFDPSDSGAAALDVVVQLDDVDMKSLVAALAPNAGLRTSGPLHAKIHAGGSVGTPTLALNFDGSAAALAYGTTFDKAADIPLSMVGNVARDPKGAIALDSIALTLGSAVIGCAGKLEPLRDGYSYALQLTGSSVALDALGRILPSLGAQTVRGSADIDLAVAASSLAAPERLTGRVSLDALELGGGNDVPLVSQLTAVLKFDGRSASLPRSALRIAGLPATLEASCPDIYAPRVRFALAAPTLALADLGVAGAAEGDALQGFNIAGTLASTPQSVDVDADVHADSGKLAGLTLTKLDAKVHRRNGTLEVAPVSFGTNDGQVRGNATYAPATDGGGDRFRFDGRADGVSVAGLVGGLTGRSASILDGKLTADLHADGAGKDWPTLRQALTGSGKIELLDGALRGVNVADSALAGITGLPGLSGLLPTGLRNDFPLLFGTNDTRFDTLSAAIDIAAGRIVTKNLAVSAHDFLMQAGGTIGLDGSVDLGATLLPSLALSQRLIESSGVMKHLADRSGRVAIPFRLVGTLPAAKPAPDLAALGSALQRGLIDNFGSRILDGVTKPPAPRVKPEPSDAKPVEQQVKPVKQQAKPATQPATPASKDAQPTGDVPKKKKRPPAAEAPPSAPPPTTAPAR